MRYRVLVTEMNIDEEAHPKAVRYMVEADSHDDASAKARAHFIELTGREPAARALIDLEPVE